MSKKRKRIDNRQGNLFDLVKKHQEEKAKAEPKAGTLNVSLQIQEIIDKSIGRSSLSRELIAGKMSELTGKQITKTMLDAWTAESKKKHRFPLEFLPAFCDALQDYDLHDFVARKCRRFVLPPEEVLRAELARRIENRENENKEIKKIKMFIKEMGNDQTEDATEK